jgi:cell division protein FtsB
VNVGARTLERDRPRLTGRAAALLVTVTVLLLLLLVPARQYLDQRARIAELERQAATLERQNDELRTRIADLHDPVELERLARECLGMVRPGEIALVTPGTATSDGC